MAARTRKVKPAASGAPKRGRGRPLVDDKRRRILDAALVTFAERGYHGTAVPEVATAAGVGTGTLYRYFAHKEALVNEVYRDAKARLRAVLFGDRELAPGVVGIDFTVPAAAWFAELWRRLGAFAAAEPDAFRFLEMQDHAPYLDNASKHVELAVLGPLWLAGKQLRARGEVGGATASTDILIALVWGAFVGLIKASRLGYLRLDTHSLQQAGDACWRMIDPAPASAPARAQPKR